MRINTIKSNIINTMIKVRSNFYLLNRKERKKNKRKLIEARKGRRISSNPNNPLVSVLIPTYNRAKILTERTLVSVLNQTYDNIEIIIVGDECTDNTEELVTKLGEKRIKFFKLSKEEKGKYPTKHANIWKVAGTDAANKAIEMSSGEWLAPCNDDDLFTEDHIENLRNYALDNDLEFVYGIVEMEILGGKFVKIGRFPPKRGQICHNSIIYHSSLKFFKYDINAWKYGEPGDWNLWRRMKEAGVKMGFFNKVVGKHFLEKREVKPLLAKIFDKIFLNPYKKFNRFLKYGGNRYICPICNNRFRKFIPLHKKFIIDLHIRGDIYTVHDAETLNVKNYSCPFCYASDRERLYYLYLSRKIGIWKKRSQKMNLIHFAPEKSLSNSIRKFPEIKYRTADLYMEDVDDKVDLTNISIYDDETFDFFICSHILEHIPNDTKGFEELYRILKKGGSGILVVPIMLRLEKTFEDFTKTTPEERLAFFGQEDHVRVYSKKDFIDKMNSAGFKVEQLGSEYFEKEVFCNHGITGRSILYKVKKI